MSVLATAPHDLCTSTLNSTRSGVESSKKSFFRVIFSTSNCFSYRSWNRCITRGIRRHESVNEKSHRGKAHLDEFSKAFQSFFQLFCNQHKLEVSKGLGNFLKGIADWKILKTSKYRPPTKVLYNFEKHKSFLNFLKQTRNFLQSNRDWWKFSGSLCLLAAFSIAEVLSCGLFQWNSANNASSTFIWWIRTKIWWKKEFVEIA